MHNIVQPTSGLKDRGEVACLRLAPEVIHILLLQRRFWCMDGPSEHIMSIRLLSGEWPGAYYSPARFGALEK